MSVAWFSLSLYRSLESDEMQEWLQAQGIPGLPEIVLGDSTALEEIHPWSDLEFEVWRRMEASDPLGFAEWCSAYWSATPHSHCLVVTVGDASRVQGRVGRHGVSVSYPASRLVTAEDPLDAVTEMILTVVDKDISKRGLGLPSLREFTTLAALREPGTV